VSEPAKSTPAGEHGAAGQSPIRYERNDATAIITICRESRRNAIDGPTAVALNEAFSRFESDEGARVLVVTGAGGEAFCAGADLKALDTFAGRLGSVEGPLGVTRLAASKPTIAAISGYCLAGGLELALWCDLRIATEDSTLGLTERRFGVPLLDGGTQRLPRVVGLGRALELILTGRMLNAREAHSMGLVSEVVASGEHLDRALALASEIAGFPQLALLADRRAVFSGLGTPLERGLALEADAGPATFQDALAGAARFAAGEGRGGAPVAAATGR
jgi:enoyl-CoA hydratase/carnithine racemase